jgi:hypothetical protein
VVIQGLLPCPKFSSFVLGVCEYPFHYGVNIPSPLLIMKAQILEHNSEALYTWYRNLPFNIAVVVRKIFLG